MTGAVQDVLNTHASFCEEGFWRGEGSICGMRIATAYIEQEVRPDAQILYTGSNSSLFGFMLPAGPKREANKLCVTVEGVDAYLAKSKVTIAIRVSRFIAPCGNYSNSKEFHLTVVGANNMTLFRWLQLGLGTLCRRESGLLRRSSHFGAN